MMLTIPPPHRVKTWLLKIRGVGWAEHKPDMDASELWNRTVTPESITKLVGMALALARVPECPYHMRRPFCRYETGEVPNCTECRLQWAFKDTERK